jgi:cell filamentation protein
MDEPYCYAGTRVLRNREDIRDADALEEFERRASRSRAETLPKDVPIRAAGYREIHRYLFQDVYEWAGKDRTVDIAGHGTFFLSVELIGPALEERVAKINDENNLRGLAPERFAARAGEHICALNAIHPFLEGNGRTMRAFLEVLAEQAGHHLDLTRIAAQAWNAASREADYMHDSRPMSDVIAGALVEPVAEIKRTPATSPRRAAYDKTEEAYARYQEAKANDPSPPKGRDR